MGFCILCDTSQQLTWRLKPVMQAVGDAAVTLTQVGYSECVGYVPEGRIHELLGAMGVFLRRERRHRGGHWRAGATQPGNRGRMDHPTAGRVDSGHDGKMGKLQSVKMGL